MMTRLIEVTREDLDTIDYDSIVAFELAGHTARGSRYLPYSTQHLDRVLFGHGQPLHRPHSCLEETTAG